MKLTTLCVILITASFLTLVMCENMFSGVFTWDRFQGGRLFLCEQKDGSIQGAYAREIDGKLETVGVIEGSVNQRKKTLSAQFVDAGGVYGKITLTQKNAASYKGSYWFYDQVIGMEGTATSLTKQENQTASQHDCLSSTYDRNVYKNLNGTWKYDNEMPGTWCVNGDSASGDNNFFASDSVSRGQTFFNGRVWSGVWMNSNNDATFANKTAGAFLKVRTLETVVEEVQYYVTDGQYFNVTSDYWSLAGRKSATKVSDDTGSCVSEKNRLPWMGTFDLNNKKSQLYICYTSGNTISGSIATFGKDNQLQVHGAVYGTFYPGGKKIAGWWFDVQEQSPYWGHFTIELNNATGFSGDKFLGDGINATRLEWSGERSESLGLFANDEQCKIASRNSYLFEGTWTNINSPLSQDEKNWNICLGTERGNIMDFVSQKEQLSGIIDRSQAIAASTSESTKVISIIRQVDTLIESHYWNKKYIGYTLNERVSYATPANNTCFAIPPKDNIIGLAVSLSLVVAGSVLFFLCLIPFLAYQFLVKKRRYSTLA